MVNKIPFAYLLLFCSFGCALLTGCAFQSEKVDLIVHNGRIYTLDENFTVTEAMAIRDGIIIETGPERQILNKYKADQYVDCHRQSVYPGFIDAHCHFLSFGNSLLDADLSGTHSWSEVVDRVKVHASAEKGEWIIGRGWDQNDWPAADTETGKKELHPFPTRDQLDELFPDRPVFLVRIDGHAAIANGEALRRAGITPQSVFPGGYVEVENGACTGILVDNAMNAVTGILPSFSATRKEEALRRAEEKCFSVGLTTLSEAGLMHSDISLIDSLQRVGKLRMRIYAMISDHPENAEWYANHGLDTTSDKLTVRSVKFYADGALGSRGACLLYPYDDIRRISGRNEYGLLLEDTASLNRKFAMWHDLGFQVNTHAIGDSANRVVLQAYARILRGPNDLRWRIEHAQVVDEKDMVYFRDYSIIPSVQPVHATSDMPWAWERLGRNRIARAYAYRELKEQLGIVALGTDFPVEDISPFATFHAAVFRQNMKGEPSDGFQTENALTREEALRGMTIWAAIANFEEHKKGSLEEGKFADFVLLDRDLMKVSPELIRETQVKLTALGGEIVYSRP